MQNVKQSRQATILQLIRRNQVVRQEQLRRLLRQAGLEATQATLSRDLRELKVVKAVDRSGILRYLQLLVPEPAGPFRCDVSGNLLVMRTEPGMAAPLAYRIDALELPEILGTVAGEDTVLAVVSEGEDAGKVRERLWEQIGQT